MKVLHILHDSFPVLSGYSIRSANIMRFQLELGLAPLALTSDRHACARGECHEPDIIDGIPYFRTLPSSGIRLPFFRELASIRRLTDRIVEVAQREQVRVLHAHSPSLWGEATRRAARRLQLRFVYEIRGLWEDALVDSGRFSATSLQYRLNRFLETRVAHSADRVVTISSHLQRELVSRGVGADRLTLVHNGVDTRQFPPMSPDLDLKAELGIGDATVIGYVGTMHPWEGVDALILAAPRIIREAPDTKFVLVGTGALLPNIRALVTENKLEDHVKLVGEVAHRDVVKYYSIVDILVYPRRSTRNTELTTPLKPLEAMAMSKAIIGSDVGGIRELLPPETALSFRSGKVDDLARQCIRLVRDPRQRSHLGRQARNHAVEAHCWKTLAARYLDVYGIESISAARLSD